MNTLINFYNAMRAAGLEPPPKIEPGRLHRFPGAGKRPGNTAGWCKLFADSKGGCFGDWSTGLSAHWQAARAQSHSKAEQAAFLRQLAQARAEAARLQELAQGQAADRARVIWTAAVPAPANHPYLVRKQIRSRWARLHKGALVLPVIDFDHRLHSLQFIDGDGTKRLLSGGRKRGCLIPVAGDPAQAPRVIICEGWATGSSLADDEPQAAVLAAIDAGNLEPVAVACRCRWPRAELVIAGDDDRLTPGNPGMAKARSAALAADALLALPQWPENAPLILSDFNDLAIWLRGGAP